jgi:hypothetical protein
MKSVTAHKYPVNDFVYFATVTARDGYYINVSHVMLESLAWMLAKSLEI